MFYTFSIEPMKVFFSFGKQMRFWSGWDEYTSNGIRLSNYNNNKIKIKDLSCECMGYWNFERGKKSILGKSLNFFTTTSFDFVIFIYL
jgi:hypothetical protein